LAEWRSFVVSACVWIRRTCWESKHCKHYKPHLYSSSPVGSVKKWFFFVGVKKESSAKKRAQVKKLVRFVGGEKQTKRQQTHQLFTLKRSCHLPRDIEWF